MKGDRVRADSWYVLTSIEDTHGKRIAFGYDANENLASVDDATGVRVATLSYTGGYLSKITDRDGREAIYTVDALGQQRIRGQRIRGQVYILHKLAIL